MDIDVKNALDALLESCAHYRHEMPNGFDLLLASDIFRFIHFISTSGAEERINSFNEIYFGGQYSTSFDLNKKSSVPDSFKYFVTLNTAESKETAALFAGFISVLGKHYVFSKYDKQEIDQDAYLQYIEMLKAYSSQKSSVPEAPVNVPIDNNLDVIETVSQDESTETLEELMEQLNSLIGLSGVKKEVSTLINILKINKMREALGQTVPIISKHLVFLGNPGTGKTTVARLLAKIYNRIGVLESGQLVEVDRAGLVAGYVGQTALKTKEKIDEAMGGILFIDEAYTLAKGGADFGQEAIDTILKAMEDNRENLVVIVAGYSGPMEDFLKSNPGLESRFNKKIVFEDYSKEELFKIFEKQCGDYKLNEVAKATLIKYLERITSNKPENFANGREMRNLFEKAIANQANRVININNPTLDELNEITSEDLGV